MNNNNYNFNNPSFKDFAGWLYKLSPTEFVTLGTIAGYLISYGLTVNEHKESYGKFNIWNNCNRRQ